MLWYETNNAIIISKNNHLVPLFFSTEFAALKNLATSSTRWFKYNRDKLWLVYKQSVPVIFEPPCTWSHWPSGPRTTQGNRKQGGTFYNKHTSIRAFFKAQVINNTFYNYSLYFRSSCTFMRSERAQKILNCMMPRKCLNLSARNIWPLDTWLHVILTTMEGYKQIEAFIF